MKRTVYLLTLLVIIVAIVSPLMAENDHLQIGPNHEGMHLMPKFGGPGGMHEGRNSMQPPVLLNPVELQNLLDEIGVNKVTSEKIVTLSRNFFKALDEKMIRVQREELNIKEELIKDKPDLQTIQSIVSKKAQIFSEIEFAQIKRDIEIKALLTEQEYDQWKAALVEHMHRMVPQEFKMHQDGMPDQKK